MAIVFSVSTASTNKKLKTSYQYPLWENEKDLEGTTEQVH